MLAVELHTLCARARLCLRACVRARACLLPPDSPHLMILRASLGDLAPPEAGVQHGDLGTRISLYFTLFLRNFRNVSA